MTTLAVDFGTTHTVAVLAAPDQPLRQLLFDGTPLLPSNVFAHPSGILYTGADATRLARTAPQRLEPAPKQRIDDGAVLLDDREWPVADLIAAVFARVAQEAARVAGDLPPVVLTHPAAWGGPRRAVLQQAAERAGMHVAGLIPEPIAAAAAFARRRRSAGPLAVFDFGGGTVDVAVVGEGAAGPLVLASEGLADLGGADLDAAVARFLLAQAGRDLDGLDAATRLELFAQARAAKETLSRTTLAEVHVPGLPVTHLTREQFDGIVAPLLSAAVALTERTVPRGAELFLVGGASRIPLVATMLHTALGTAPVVLEQPELAVAEGAALSRREPVAEAPVPVPAEPPVVAAPAPRRRNSRAAVAAGLVAVIAVAVVVVAWRPWDRGAGPVDHAAGRGASSAPPPTSAATRPQWPADDTQASVHALPGIDPEALPAMPTNLSGWELAQDTTIMVRLYDGKTPGLVSNFPSPSNHCGVLRFLVVWRTTRPATVRAQFVNPFDGSALDDSPVAEGSSGWMSVTGCAQPSWLDLGDEQSMVDVSVHYQVWSFV
ncbi:MAG TPA: Hsp70 family protein [Dactylosporangium sp.]|nr:Hsp70 family protein [Dactylosporangium sp.]